MSWYTGPATSEAPGSVVRRFTITPLSACAIGSEMAAAAIAAPASAAWQTANAAIYVPFFLEELFTVTQMFTYNGAAVSGNIDVGLYTEGGTRIVSAGTTAQSGTAALQVYNTTDVALVPGRYYMAVALDNATGELFQSTASVPLLRMFGVAREAAAFVLPATATFAAVATATLVPMIGLSGRSVI